MYLQRVQLLLDYIGSFRVFPGNNTDTGDFLASQVSQFILRSGQLAPPLRNLAPHLHYFHPCPGKFVIFL